MKVGIRADASKRMGTGHLRRCLSLARALRQQGDDVVFVTRDLGIDSAAMIAEQDFADIRVLPAASGDIAADPAIPHADWTQVKQSRDIAETIDALAGIAPDWVVVDSYGFDGRWHDGVRGALSCRIAAVDDVPDRTMAVDLLIDHNYAADHRAKYADCIAQDTRLLGGPSYALLGPRYANAQRYRFSEDVRSVGVFMGGVDAGGYSLCALEALRSAGFAGPVEIATTTANPHLDELRQCAECDHSVRLSIDLPDLAEFFARHDLQIGAGGGASWERCCIGVPTLLVVVAENQLAVAPRLAEEGIVALALDPRPATLASALEPLLQNADKRAELARRSRALVDGKGAARVAREMQCFA